MLDCTLLSAIPEAARGIVEAKVNDFKEISQWTAQRHGAVHDDEVALLREQVKQVTSSLIKRRLLIATHHAPCIESTFRQEHDSNPWVTAFATELVNQHGGKGVKTWVFGHTHYSASSCAAASG
ncbi:hypothetical protein N657DRAFT_651587 [Parathielavia appendiculata]|uniref:Calcineurin-like phosphoesterase domain-containing protein n=1 Tax=Parathielavia appendiculata TaxID=2587402 RepID=A0AAN6TP79_9PEZI|nr:hypothetical protein N657DRAFT_651587 [Parathielavia appendiculata]